MADVYSARIASAPAVNAGPVTVYTCPPDVLTVVKGISVVWGDITVSGLDAWVQLSDLCKWVRATFATGIGGVSPLGGVAQYWGMWVCEPGEEIQAQTATGTVDVTLAGYQLALP